jgi:ribokinase
MLIVAGSYILEHFFRSARHADNGETAYGLWEGSWPGGRGFSQARAAHRAGLPVRFFAAVGDDVSGRTASEEARLAGFESFFVSKSDSPTGMASVHQADNAEPRKVVAAGANRLMLVEDFPSSWWKEARALLCQFEANPSASAKFLREARKHKLKTILHASPAPAEDVRATVAGVDLVFAEERAFSELIRQYHPGGYGDFTEEQIHVLSDRNLHQLCRSVFLGDLVLHLGRRGCFVSGRDDCFKLFSPMRGLSQKCLHGAQDAFVGAFVAEFLRNPDDIFAAATFANAASALAMAREHPGDPFSGQHEIRQLFKKGES